MSKHFLYHTFKQRLRLSIIRSVILLLASSVLLSACKKEDKDSRAGDVRILRPANNLALSNQGDLTISYDGFANSDNVEIYLNDVLCYDARDPANDAETCRLYHNRAYGMATTSLMSLGGLVLLGDNYVRVKNTDTDTEKTVGFNFDNQDPRVDVTQIQVSADTGALNLLDAGDLVTLKGIIFDVSAIKWNSRIFQVQVETTPGNYQLQRVCNEEEYANGATPSPSACILGSHFTYQVEVDPTTYRATNHFVISGIQWPDKNAPKPHFVYSIKDVNGQTGKKEFVVSGTDIENSQAFQINNTMLQKLKILPNLFAGKTVEFVNDCSPTSTDPECQFKVDLINKINTDYINPNAKEICSMLGWDTASCTGEVTNISISKPSTYVVGRKNTGFGVQAGVQADSVSLPIIIRSGSNYYRTTAALNDFAIFSNIDFQGVGNTPDALIKIKRGKAVLHLFSSVWGNKQIYLTNSYCSGSCGLTAGLLEPFYNLRLTTQGKRFADSIVNMLQDETETLAERIFGPSEQELTFSHQSASTLKDLQRVSQVFNLDANPLPLVDDIRNGHFRFIGGFDANNSLVNTVDDEGNSIVIVEHPSLGSEFKDVKDSYDYIKNGGYPSIFGGRSVELAYGISVDTINQYLLADYQRGVWNNKQIELTNVDPSLFDGATSACIEINTQSPPQIEFTGYYHKVLGFSWEFTGLNLLDTNKDDIPGSIKLRLDSSNLTVKQGDCATGTVLATNMAVDAAIHVSAYMRNGKPVITKYGDYAPYEQFQPAEDDVPVTIRAKDRANTAIADKLTKAISANLQQRLNEINTDQVEHLAINNLDLGQTLNDVRDVLVEPMDWWLQYGLRFQSFGIAPNGGYLSMILIVDQKSGNYLTGGKPECKTDAEGYYRTYCITHD